MELYLYDREQQTGPFPAETIREMLNAGSVTQDAMVWHQGAPDWIPLTTFLAQSAAGTAPVVAAHQVRVAAHTPVVSMTTGSSLGSTGPTEAGVFLRATAAGLAVALIGGALWAAFQIGVHVQLPYIIGVGLAWLCGATVDKVSHGTSGPLYTLLTFGCVILAWVVGIFGVIVGGYLPLIGIWTIVCFVIALGVAWKAATQ